MDLTGCLLSGLLNYTWLLIYNSLQQDCPNPVSITSDVKKVMDCG